MATSPMADRSGAVDVAKLAAALEHASPEEILRVTLATFGRDVALAWSGAEDVALVDMLMSIDRKARVFLIDTGRLNQETYLLVDRVRDRYGCTVEVLFPDTAATERMVRAKGMNLFYDSIDHRKECCGVRKVEPLARALRGLRAWITGMRRDQGTTRADVPVVSVDEVNGGIVKVNPLADWTQERVFAYLQEKGVPYNKLHDLGYASIGCAPCTRPVLPGESVRSGRWWWEDESTRECGLHVKR